MQAEDAMDTSPLRSISPHRGCWKAAPTRRGVDLQGPGRAMDPPGPVLVLDRLVLVLDLARCTHWLPLALGTISTPDAGGAPRAEPLPPSP